MSIEVLTPAAAAGNPTVVSLAEADRFERQVKAWRQIFDEAGVVATEGQLHRFVASMLADGLIIRQKPSSPTEQ
jgi:hypothetical protein